MVKQVNLGKSGRVRCGERTLELLLRDDFVCMGCRRRKRIGLVFCWVCWDKGCSAKTTSSKRTYFRSPYTFAGLSISSWLGIYSEHTLEDEAKECWNRKLKNLRVPEEYEEDPLYEPVSATVSVIMTNGKTEAPLRPQIRFVHSNVCLPHTVQPSKRLQESMKRKDQIPRKSLTDP